MRLRIESAAHSDMVEVEMGDAENSFVKELSRDGVEELIEYLKLSISCNQFIADTMIE